jgi:hypothetical protein
MINFLCSVDDCGEKPIANQLCQYHYDRKRRYGDLTTRPKSLVCADCQSEFAVKKTGKVSEVCDACQTERHRKRIRADRRRKGLWEYYKLTLSEYQAMHDAQGGVCLICGGVQTGRGAKNNQLSVDHNHKTGKIRGLLCTNCNTGIGNLRDSIELLEKAITYLKERDK